MAPLASCGIAQATNREQPYVVNDVAAFLGAVQRLYTYLVYHCTQYGRGNLRWQKIQPRGRQSGQPGVGNSARWAAQLLKMPTGGNC